MTTATVRPLAAAELGALPIAVNVTGYAVDGPDGGFIVYASCRGAVTILQVTGSDRVQARLVARVLDDAETAIAVAPLASCFDLVTALGLPAAPAGA
jgi:hypothetical protein